MTKKIPLSRGKFALVDDEDYERVNKDKWYARKIRNIWYAERLSKTGTTMLHRLVMKAPKGLEVDHINRNGLDCRKRNMRLCTRAQNQHNSGKQVNNTSGFKGVSRAKGRKKWTALIRVNGDRFYLGSFTDPVEAAKAYDKAARKYHGEFARTNFD